MNKQGLVVRFATVAALAGAIAACAPIETYDDGGYNGGSNGRYYDPYGYPDDYRGPGYYGPGYYNPGYYGGYWYGGGYYNNGYGSYVPYPYYPGGNVVIVHDHDHHHDDDHDGSPHPNPPPQDQPGPIHGDPDHPRRPPRDPGPRPQSYPARNGLGLPVPQDGGVPRQGITGNLPRAPEPSRQQRGGVTGNLPQRQPVQPQAPQRQAPPAIQRQEPQRPANPRGGLSGIPDR